VADARASSSSVTMWSWARAIAAVRPIHASHVAARVVPDGVADARASSSSVTMWSWARAIAAVRPIHASHVAAG